MENEASQTLVDAGLGEKLAETYGKGMSIIHGHGGAYEFIDFFPGLVAVMLKF